MSGIGAGLVVAAALAAGCAHQRTPAPAPVASSVEPAAAPATPAKGVAAAPKFKSPKGIGATGGPAGRDDLRPNKSP